MSLFCMANSCSHLVATQQRISSFVPSPSIPAEADVCGWPGMAWSWQPMPWCSPSLALAFLWLPAPRHILFPASFREDQSLLSFPFTGKLRSVHFSSTFPDHLWQRIATANSFLGSWYPPPNTIGIRCSGLVTVYMYASLFLPSKWTWSWDWTEIRKQRQRVRKGYYVIASSPEVKWWLRVQVLARRKRHHFTCFSQGSESGLLLNLYCWQISGLILGDFFLSCYTEWARSCDPHRIL